MQADKKADRKADKKDRRPGQFRLVALVAGAAMVAVIGAVTLAPNFANRDPFADCRASNVAGGAGAIGGPFTLVNAQGQTVTDADVFTKPSLVYFGYTFCPDVCPLDLARNAEALDLIARGGRETQGVFISIDPERDTPEVVGEYASYMHPDMIGLTGSPEQVAAAARAYRTYYRKHPSEDGYYTMDHSTQTYLVLPEVGFVEFFRRDDSPEEVARRTACFIDAS